MKRLPVLKMGHPNLRKSAQSVPVDQINHPDIQNLIDGLVQTMRDENGAGIAAPQVDVGKQIFVIEISDNPRYPDKVPFELLVAINPEITPIGDHRVESWEGCLSIPNIRGKLWRWEKVAISAYDREGNYYKKELSDFAAVVAQHELDHLHGVLFIDRMEDMKSLSFREEYDRFIAKI